MRIVVGCAIVVAAVAHARAGTLTARVLGHVGEGHSLGLVFSADGRHYAYVRSAMDGSPEVVVADGVAGEPLDEVRDLRFAGKRLVYRARTDRAWRVFVGGTAGDAYRDVDELAVSADGAHVAYSARTRDGTVVVFDGVAGPPFDSVSELQVAGARWAYMGERERAQHAVVDGVVSEPFYYVRDLAFSADGARCAYLANQDGGGLHVVADRRRWSMGAGAYGGDVTWTGGGNVLAWWEKRAGGPVVVVEGVATDVPADPFIKAVAATRTRGKRAAVAVIAEDTRRHQYAAVIDRAGRRAGPPFTTADSLTFSRDGRRFAYRGWDGDGARWIVDGVPGPSHDDVLHASFSPDGRHVAYPAQDGTLWRMVVDGVAGDPSDLDEGIGPPVWSRDSRHLAYFILDGDPSVVVDGVRVATIRHAVELRWVMRARGRRLVFGDVARDGAITWYELAP